jgi:TolB-like protein
VNGNRKPLSLMFMLLALLLVVSSFIHAAPGPAPVTQKGWLIAVFPLEDLVASEETKGLGEQIAATLTDGLARSGEVRVVERRQLQQILEELKLSASGLIDEQTAIRAGKILGANALLLGSFLKFQDSVKINVRVVKTETGEILSTERVAGKFSALFELEEKLAAGILPRLQNHKP